MTELKSNLYSDDETNEDENSTDSEYFKKSYNKIASSVSLYEENIIQKKLHSMDIRMNNVDIYYSILFNNNI